VSGISFVGVDVPGFFGDPDDELYVLFYQLGMTLPFFRAHGHVKSYAREPYLQTLEVLNLARDAIKFRYSLIHYLYTAFERASNDGIPIMRPLWMDFPDDPLATNIEN